jgi:hypothetical protein
MEGTCGMLAGNHNFIYSRKSLRQNATLKMEVFDNSKFNLKGIEYNILTDLLKALLGNGSINTPRYAHATIGRIL